MKIERTTKVELIQRLLAIKHKLKVHESLDQPTTHEELSVYLLARWELEDELHAIEEILAMDRKEAVEKNKKLIEQGVIGRKTPQQRATKKLKSSEKYSN